jgi:hypothetical protein
MPIQFIADVPDSAAISRGVADSGVINKIAIDAQFRAHVAFVSNIATGGGDNTLTYAIGTPDGPLQFFGFQPLIVLKQYQWQFFAVVPPAQWDILSLFDLALDSAGRAHLCYAEMDTFDHAPAPNLKHAVWNAANSQFDSSVVQNSSFATGLAMTIAADDSVHVAFSDDLGLHYATQARGANSFQLAVVNNQQPATVRDVSIAVGSTGQIGISYIFQTTGANTLGFQLRYAQKMPAGWTVDTADPGPLNSGNTWLMDVLHPGANSLLIDGFGVPHIAYFSASRGLCHATRTVPGQFFWTVSPSGNGELVDAAGQATSAKILLDSNNVLHIAYQAKNQTGATEVRFATRATAGTWGTLTVDSTSTCGWGTSAAMDSKGLPHFIYGFTPIINGLIALKHMYTYQYAQDRLPIHCKKPTKPILTRPNQV